MSIADELRDYAYHRVDVTRDPLLAIADNIDAAHRSALEKLAAQVDESGALPMTDENMAEHGWVRLPVDADGVPIRVGDKINVYQAKNVEVVGVGNQVVFTHHYMGDYHKHFAGDCHHHRAPTVEDVLREFALACEDAGNAGPEVERIAAEYAAKLRLAGEGE